MKAPIVVGVRHHSPACAALVADLIAQTQPAYVLVEGPADFNPRIHELLLDHTPPIAIFSYLRDSGGHFRSCWTPLCAYSPEWIALRSAVRHRAQPLFIDLPGWSRAFEDTENRYSDRNRPGMNDIARKLGYDDSDRCWDSLFEQPRPQLHQHLTHYFQELRDLLGEVSPNDQERETYMASCIAWACQQAHPRNVLVVCGGYHAPRLQQLSDPPAEFPPLPPSPPDSETGNFLVPFTFARLDSFQGYAAGMPCPGYHQWVWEEGLPAAAQRGLQETFQRLRQRKQSASSADYIAAQLQMQGLQRLRGHHQPARTDVLDGLASALLKTALEQPLPWSQRGTLARGSDPILVEIVAAFCGDQRGQLDPSTPQPPLVAHTEALLNALALQPTRPARKLALHILQNRDQSVCLHRLQLLNVAGFQRLSGPTSVTRHSLDEEWLLEDLWERASSLIEAAHYGPDLASAAQACLLRQIPHNDAASLAHLFSQALFADLPQLGQNALHSLHTALSQENQPASLATALPLLLEIFRHDRLLGGRGRQDLHTALQSGFQRCIWLYEDLHQDGPGVIPMLVAARDIQRHLPPLSDPHHSQAATALALMVRASLQTQRDPALRGAALGYLWSMGQRHDAILPLAPRDTADFLVGLLSLAREEVLDDPQLIARLDQQISGWSQQEFLLALPALRLAFSKLPPLEREQLARLLASRRGREIGRNWLKLDIAPHHSAAAMALEERLQQHLHAHGWEANPPHNTETAHEP